MSLENAPKFNVGEQVKVQRNFTYGHSRAPSYVQGCIGEIEIHHGGHVFPDANAKGKLVGEHLYAVRFSRNELWGPSTNKDEVLIDLWEPYLESAN